MLSDLSTGSNNSKMNNHDKCLKHETETVVSGTKKISKYKIIVFLIPFSGEKAICLKYYGHEHETTNK